MNVRVVEVRRNPTWSCSRGGVAIAARGSIAASEKEENGTARGGRERASQDLTSIA